MKSKRDIGAVELQFTRHLVLSKLYDRARYRVNCNAVKPVSRIVVMAALFRF